MSEAAALDLAAALIGGSDTIITSICSINIYTEISIRDIVPRKYKQGKYIPINRDKYKGDPTKIKYRSSWELQFIKWCDLDKNVLAYSYEELVIPYINPLDGRTHRYFPDFYVKVQTASKQIEQWIVEIKPKKQTEEPKKQKRMTKRYINEVATYAVNYKKWEAAEIWCKKHGFKFVKITEKDLNR